MYRSGNLEPEQLAVFQTAFAAACHKLAIDPQPILYDADEHIREQLATVISNALSCERDPAVLTAFAILVVMRSRLN